MPLLFVSIFFFGITTRSVRVQNIRQVSVSDTLNGEGRVTCRAIMLYTPCSCGHISNGSVGNWGLAGLLRAGFLVDREYLGKILNVRESLLSIYLFYWH